MSFSEVYLYINENNASLVECLTTLSIILLHVIYKYRYDRDMEK